MELNISMKVANLDAALLLLAALRETGAKLGSETVSFSMYPGCAETVGGEPLVETGAHQPINWGPVMESVAQSEDALRASKEEGPPSA